MRLVASSRSPRRHADQPELDIFDVFADALAILESGLSNLEQALARTARHEGSGRCVTFTPSGDCTKLRHYRKLLN
jgi:hypothetical protein